MRQKPSIRSLRTLVFAISIGAAAASQAQVRTWHNIGEIGGPVLWAAGLGSSLVQDGSVGLGHAARTLDGMLASGGIAELLKVTTRERRPYGTDLDSFPSGHATLSFAVAAAQAYYHPRQAPFWYGAATFIGIARVAGHDHFIQDVVVGAGLGYAAGQLSASSHRGWFVAPLIERGRPGFMLSFSRSF
ncbi:MAG: phosphatase PAP2 family protein [Fimbriimonadaceae bacterium]